MENDFLMAFSRPLRDAACDWPARTNRHSMRCCTVNNGDLIRKIDSPWSHLGRWLKERGRPPRFWSRCISRP